MASRQSLPFDFQDANPGQRKAPMPTTETSMFSWVYFCLVYKQFKTEMESQLLQVSTAAL